MQIVKGAEAGKKNQTLLLLNLLGQVHFGDGCKGEKFRATEEQVRGKTDFTGMRCCAKTI